jgi:hypothetical protein
MPSVVAWKPHDVHSLDEIVSALEANGGRFSELLHGIIQSAPFQRQRQPARGLTVTATAAVHSSASPHPLP